MKKSSASYAFLKIRPTLGLSPPKAQLLWSLCVAAAVAIVALQQAVGSHQARQRTLGQIGAQIGAPTRDSGLQPQPQNSVVPTSPLSEDELRMPQNSLQ